MPQPELPDSRLYTFIDRSREFAIYFLDGQRTYRRKYREAVMAVARELRYDKQALLHAYGNEIYVGQQGTRKRQQLSLPDAEPAAALADVVRVAIFERLHEVVEADGGGRGIDARMTPCLVPDISPLGQLKGGTNMVVLEGDSVEQIVLRGEVFPSVGHGVVVLVDRSDLAPMTSRHSTTRLLVSMSRVMTSRMASWR